MRVVFAGTPEFSVPCLETLISSPEIDVVGVYTQPDRPAGRGKTLSPSAVKICAEKSGLSVFQPESFMQDPIRSELESLQPDLILVVAYGIILPDWVLELPKRGCLNVHASLLPRWRGAAPIQRAIEAGDSVTGVSLMEVEPTLDSGPVLASLEVDIDDNETGGTLHDKLAKLGSQLLQENLHLIIHGGLDAVTQDESLVTYARKLSREESRLDWQQDAVEIERKIRALNPWPAATVKLGQTTLKILHAQVVGHNNPGEPGEILKADKSGLWVQTGNGALSLESIQKPGGNPMSARDLLNGISVTPGLTMESQA